jgi:hypothetical protein
MVIIQPSAQQEPIVIPGIADITLTNLIPAHSDDRTVVIKSYRMIATCCDQRDVLRFGIATAYYPSN